MDKQALRLDVTMPDGSVWRVPAHLVASDRAAYYTAEGSATAYEREFCHTLTDHGELTDWARNNMNWSDVADKAVCIVPSSAVDYQEGWVNGYMNVVPVLEGAGS